jgi:hypothetical protein
MTSKMITLALVLVVAWPAQGQAPKVTVKLTNAKVVTADHMSKKTPEGDLTLHGFFPADWTPAGRPRPRRTPARPAAPDATRPSQLPGSLSALRIAANPAGVGHIRTGARRYRGVR